MEELSESDFKKQVRELFLEGGTNTPAFREMMIKRVWNNTGKFGGPSDNEISELIEYAFDEETEEDKKYNKSYILECQRIACASNQGIEKPPKSKTSEMEDIRDELVKRIK